MGFSSSTFQQGSFTGGGGGTSQQVEIRSQTINGVTHRVKKTIDSDGNEHEERTYPDGRKEVLYNGVLQGNEPARIEDSGSSRKKRHDTQRIEAPRDRRYPDSHTAEKKRHWWSGGR